MKITSYSFGSITIEGKTYTYDVLIFPTKVEKWWRREGHFCSLDDLKSVLEFKPEMLVIGKGSSGIMETAPNLEQELNKRGIKLIAANTAEACKIYNKLKKKKVAALHLTC